MSTEGAALTYVVEPGGALRGTLRVPGDKSISHRAVMLGSLADGVSDVTGFLTGEDCLCTMKAFQAMGVRIEQLGPTHLRIHGVGLGGLRAPAGPLDLGNSGTSMRLMSGLMAAQDFTTTLTGDSSLSKRPMRRIVDPLRAMGAAIETSDKGSCPLVISKAPNGLRAIAHESPVASAQVKSGILLAGLYAEGLTEVREPEASRDHTERMLRGFGVEVEARPGYAALRGGQRLKATNIEVPADISSATFPMVAAAIVPGSDRSRQRATARRRAGCRPAGARRETVRHHHRRRCRRQRHRRISGRVHRSRLCRRRDHGQRRRGTAGQGIRSHRRDVRWPERPRRIGDRQG
jgi:3-phosphoshikimate 1-carboxyvinyltransferase